MRILTALLIAGALVVPALAQTPAADTAPASLIREGVTEKLTDQVWAIPDGGASLVPNVGIVVGSKAVLVVDTGMGARNAQTILREVAKVGADKPVYIVSTHYHPEHDLGAHAFPAGSKMIRSKAEEADIAQYGLALANTFAGRSPLNAELLKNVTYRPADISFDKDYVLDLGDVKAKIIAQGPNHTRGDTVVLVEDSVRTNDGGLVFDEPARVLFSGDIVMRGQPSFAAPESSLAHWLVSLDTLAAMNPTHIVPAHGRRGDGAMIDAYRAYLTKIRDRAAALKKEGKSQADTATQITAEMPEQPDKARLAGAIRNAWTEAK